MNSRTATAQRQSDTSQATAPPLVGSRWQLAVSLALVIGWLGFLAYTALA